MKHIRRMTKKLWVTKKVTHDRWPQKRSWGASKICQRFCAAVQPHYTQPYFLVRRSFRLVFSLNEHVIFFFSHGVVRHALNGLGSFAFHPRVIVLKLKPLRSWLYTVCTVHVTLSFLRSFFSRFTSFRLCHTTAVSLNSGNQWAKIN